MTIRLQFIGNDRAGDPMYNIPASVSGTAFSIAIPREMIKSRVKFVDDEHEVDVDDKWWDLMIGGD